MCHRWMNLITRCVMNVVVRNVMMILKVVMVMDGSQDAFEEVQLDKMAKHCRHKYSLPLSLTLIHVHRRKEGNERATVSRFHK